MTNMDILNEVHAEWIEFYKEKKSKDPLEYPTLKVFTAKMLKEIMRNNRGVEKIFRP